MDVADDVVAGGRDLPLELRDPLLAGAIRLMPETVRRYVRLLELLR